MDSLWVRTDTPGTYINLNQASHIEILEYQDSWRGDEESDAFFAVVVYTSTGKKIIMFAEADYEKVLAAAERLWSAIKNKCDVIYPY